MLLLITRNYISSYVIGEKKIVIDLASKSNIEVPFLAKVKFARSAPFSPG